MQYIQIGETESQKLPTEIGVPQRKMRIPYLCLLLSVCYTCMFKHSYMPQSMINSIIVPLVKNKCGNQTDKNNYRPKAMSSITSKVFEHIILLRLEDQ